MLDQKIILRIAFLVVLAGFISLNIFQTRQYYKGVIHWDSMSKKTYWDTYFRMKPSPTLYNNITPPDYEAALKGDR